MKVKSLFVTMVAGLLLDSGALAQTWLTDFSRAKTLAREQDRAVFLFFTGSDWCGWCKKLDREILTTPEFTAFASENLVLVKVDFPRYAPLSPEQTLANQQLSQSFQIAGYPTICVLNKEGQRVGELGYIQGGPEPFLNRVRGFSGVNWRTGSGGGAAPATKPTIAKAEPVAVPMFNGAQLLPPKRYNELQLTGIMGTKKRPMIIVNNQSLVVGETGRVRLKDGEVLVTCKEIRPKSALVLLEGSPVATEIFLASGK